LCQILQESRSGTALDPDPHASKMIDPDPHIINADPKHWPPLMGPHKKIEGRVQAKVRVSVEE
jgi:hypothetical protein